MKEVKVIKTQNNQMETGEQGFLFDQLSQESGTKTVSMFLAAIAPGQHIPPHMHTKGCETLVYILSGRVRHLYGENLKSHVDNEAGDFVSIPDELPHQPINLSAIEPVRAIIACNYDQNNSNYYIPYQVELTENK